ncbi:MAG: tannase/feruloyl esterase family alpha/beta hydrolase, partial [Pseudomonas sp.]|nr:tannase/feruloyl esterase family alpha/beta hydrolase [Pseudomonas sp.]
MLTLAMAAQAHAEDTCSALAARALPDATITVAEAIAPGQYPMPENPLTRLASFSGMNPAGRPAVGPNPAFCR